MQGHIGGTIAPEQVTPRYRATVLGMFLLVYAFNFIDRQILGILAMPIKADLGLTDGQLGALGGIAFALLYTTLGIPLAMVADRHSRTWMVTGALAVWSGFTALCGLATGFWQLFLCRLGVGIGEAGGTAPSYAAVADYFPAHQRSRALAVYSLGIPLGMASGALLGGWIATRIDWRWAFIVIGLAGLVLAPVFRLVVKEPARAPSSSAAAGAPVDARRVFRVLAGKRSFWLLSFGASMASMCGYGVAFWLPSILVRSFGFDLQTTSLFQGSLLLVGGTMGVFAGGWLADRLGQANRGSYAKIPAIAFLAVIPLFAAGFMSDQSPVAAWLLLLVPHGLFISWLAPVTTSIQHLVAPGMRATATACFLFINNLIGLGAGTWVMGALSDIMSDRYGNDALRYAAVISLTLYVAAATLMLLAIRPLRREWVD